MKPDLYSKIILTIIAIALIGILLKDYDIIPNAHARSDEVMDVRITGFDKNAFGPTYAPIILPVEIKKPLALDGRSVEVEDQH